MDGLSKTRVLGLDSPLLDYVVNVDEFFCKQYGLKQDDAILASEQHMLMYDELVQDYDVEYIAGGATLNTVKMIQWLEKESSHSTVIGCIGNDKVGKSLREECEKLGVCPKFQVAHDGSKTGKCAVLVQGGNRSMVTYLGASTELQLSYVESPSVWSSVEKAQIYYLAGYAFNACYEGVMKIAKHAFNQGKMFYFNLSAPYLQMCQAKRMDTILPYVDVLFGNWSEAQAYAETHGFPQGDVKSIARSLANIKRPDGCFRKRIVLLTHAEYPILVASTANPYVRKYLVPHVDDREIVDTNGAGDAFAAGFVATYTRTKSINRAIKAAIKAASYIIRRSGFSLGPRDQF